MRLWKKIPNCWRCVFFDSAQTVTASRQNALHYDGSASGQIIYIYVGGNPISRKDRKGLDWDELIPPHPEDLLPPGFDQYDPSTYSPAPAPTTSSGLTGNLSISVPLPIGRVPTGLVCQCKIGGSSSCYVGAGLVVGSSFSWMPRSSFQGFEQQGDTSGWAAKASASTSGIRGPLGATGSITVNSSGTSISGGPAIVGGSPSGSLTGGYNFQF